MRAARQLAPYRIAASLGLVALLLAAAGLVLAAERRPVERPALETGDAPRPVVGIDRVPGTGGPATAPSCGGVPALSATEVGRLVEAAAAALDEPMTVAVVDRAGRILALLRKAGTAPGDEERAVGLARTGAFFSNDQAPLSSRTVRFISGLHFPPRVSDTPNAALYGIENTNRGCELDVDFAPGKAVPPAKSFRGGPCNSLDASGCGTGPVTGKRDASDSDQAAIDPGGVPIFRGSTLLGGIGVVGPEPRAEAEFAAVAALAAEGFLPAVAPPGQVFIDGIRLPFVEQVDRPAGSAPDPRPLAGGTFVVAPADGGCVPDGFLVEPRAGSRLSRAEVEGIVARARAVASRTRAVIRLPLGSRSRMVIAVGDVDGTILALFRMPDATVFSIDVAVAKARNVAYFSMSAGKGTLPGVAGPTAVTNRTISFGSQPLFPAGIDGSGPGPFFDSLFRPDFARPCRQGDQPPGPRQNGVVFFPGSVPLYEGRALVGGLGISGDGVEQDDYVAFRGAEGFQAPRDLWADRVFVDGVRLPYVKFPRNPEG